MSKGHRHRGVLAACACGGSLLVASMATSGLPNFASAPGGRLDLATAEKKLRVSESFGRLPLQFEVNRGQVDGNVKYFSRAGGYQLFLTDDEAVFSFLKRERKPGAAEDPCDPQSRRRRHRHEDEVVTRSVVRMRLEGANPKPRFDPLERLPGDVNYFIGNDPKRWRTDIPTYRKVAVKNVYKGVDLVYYGNRRQLEYDFVVSPGADPNVIRMAFTGADAIETDAKGDLRLATAGGTVTMKKPAVYQEIAGQRVEVPGGYVLEGTRVAFRVEGYDRRQALVIDPVLVYSTYVGGSSVGSTYGMEAAEAIAVDSSGVAYVAGMSWSLDFPTTPGAYRSTRPTSFYDVPFVTALNPSGTALVFSTWIGGTNSGDGIFAIALGSDGIFITGNTNSQDYPITPYAFDSSYQAVFLTKLNMTGSDLVFSTFVGGGQHDAAYAIGLHGGIAYIAGETSDYNGFPTTPGAFIPDYMDTYGSGFLTAVAVDGRTLVFSTYLRGTTCASMPFTTTKVTSLAVDAGGAIIVGGSTNNLDFPTTTGSSQRILGGPGDGFVSKFSASGALLASTLIGGNEGDSVTALALDNTGKVSLTGLCGANFPVSTGAYRNTLASSYVAQLSSDLTQVLRATYFANGTTPNGIAVDGNGRVFVAGQAGGGFPTTPGALKTGGTADAFLSVFQPSLDALYYSTRLGGDIRVDAGNVWDDAAIGLALDAQGNAYVAGLTSSIDFPVTPGAFEGTYRGGIYDAFVSKIAPPAPTSAAAILPVSGPSLGGTPVTITGAGFQTGATVALGGSPASVTSLSPTEIQATTGPHAAGAVDVVVTNPDFGVASLPGAFTYVCSDAAPTGAVSGTTAICPGQAASLSVALTGSGPWTIVWSDGVTQSGITSSPATRSVSPVATTTYTVTTVTDTVCAGASTGGATITVNPTPSSAITAGPVWANSTGNVASVPTVSGATYAWTIANGTITGGNGTSSITFSVGASGSVTLGVTVTALGCSSTSSRVVAIDHPPCDYSFSPVSDSAPSGASTGQITVSGAPTGCNGGWSVASDATAWLSLTGTTSGSGPGTWAVAYSYSANVTSSARSGHLDFTPSGGATFTSGSQFTLWQALAVTVRAGSWTWVGGSNGVNGLGTYGTKGVADPASAPGPRYRAVSWVDAGGSFWMFGGNGNGASANGLLNDLWKWDGVLWKWVAGSNGVNQVGTYGTKGTPASGNVPGGRRSAVSWKDAGGNLWLFGGTGYAASGSGYLNDLWRWDGASWTWVSGSNAINQVGTYGSKGAASPSNVPGARDSAVSWTDSTGNLWLFGGIGYSASGTGYLNDLWMWDGTNWTWISGSDTQNQAGIYGTKGLAAPGNVPGARFGAAAWSDPSGAAWVFGGEGYSASGSGYLNDLWKWDGASWTWIRGSNGANEAGTYGTSRVASPSNVPGAREWAISWRDFGGNLWLFGGWGKAANASGQLNDLWKWDGSSWTWMSGSNATAQLGAYGTKGAVSPSNMPGSRFGPVSWVDPVSSLWLFGGSGQGSASEGSLSDLWVYGLRGPTRYYAVNPCRIFDTRNSSGDDAASPALQAGATRTFAIAGRCGLPPSAAALSTNVTVTGPAASGELTIYPADAASVPNTSSISFGAGKTRANNAMLLLAADGSGIGVLNASGGTVHFILDVNGYFE